MFKLYFAKLLFLLYFQSNKDSMVNILLLFPEAFNNITVLLNSSVTIIYI